MDTLPFRAKGKNLLNNVFLSAFCDILVNFATLKPNRKIMLIFKWLNTFGNYLILMGRSLSRPERMRMFLKRYIKEMSQLGVD